MGVYIPQAHSEVPLAQQVEALIVMVIEVDLVELK